MDEGTAERVTLEPTTDSEAGATDSVSKTDSRLSGQAWKRWAPIVLVVALGVALRTLQYFAQVDMWYDELAIARNIEDRGMLELLRPLEHFQVAPFGFLALVDATTSVFGVTATGLRLGPWLFGLASLLLFWRVARRCAEGFALLAVLTLFAVSPALIWYGQSVKPYIGDVAVTLTLVWLSLRYLERPEDTRRALFGAAAGAVLLQFSFPAVPTAAILGLLLLLGWWRERPRPSPRPLLVLLGGWAGGVALAGLVASGLVDQATDVFMRNHWRVAGFPPDNLPSVLSWAGTNVYGAFSHALIFIPPSNILLAAVVALAFALGITGLAVLARRDWIRAAILLAPPAAGLAAATIHLLPFDGGRLSLYAAWPFFILAGAGLQGLRARTTGRWRWMPRTLALVTAAPLLAIVLVAVRPPYTDVPSGREAAEQLAEALREGDRIYVYTQGRHAMAFYGVRAGIEEWMQGERHYDDPRGYLAEVDVLRGSPRAWFFWVNVDGGPDPAWIREYLGTIGEKLDRIPDELFGPAGAVLYDLSDPERLRAASADSFPPPRESGG